MRARDIGELLLLAALWGASFLFLRMGAGEFGPVALAGPGGMQLNPDFLPTMQANFPPDAKLVLGCKSGGRSARGCDLLESSGYSNVANMDGGFLGRFDPMGQLVQPGWSQCELPVSTDTGDGVGYASLAAKP